MVTEFWSKENNAILGTSQDAKTAESLMVILVMVIAMELQFVQSLKYVGMVLWIKENNVIMRIRLAVVPAVLLIPGINVVQLLVFLLLALFVGTGLLSQENNAITETTLDVLQIARLILATIVEDSPQHVSGEIPSVATTL